jgi:hypothetical protein
MRTEKKINDVQTVQHLPTHANGSVDVLESLRDHIPAEIFAQLEERVALGVRKYGTRLETHNGRDSLLDCVQEALDGIMYSQQAKLEGIDSGQLVDLFVMLTRNINRRRTE